MPCAFMFMLFRVLSFRIILSVFHIPDLLFRVQFVAIPVFRILLQPTIQRTNSFFGIVIHHKTAKRKANNAIYKLGPKKFSIPALKMCFTMKNILLVLKKRYYQY